MLLSLGQGRFRGKKMTRFVVNGICGRTKPWRLFCCAGKSGGKRVPVGKNYGMGQVQTVEPQPAGTAEIAETFQKNKAAVYLHFHSPSWVNGKQSF